MNKFISAELKYGGVVIRTTDGEISLILENNKLRIVTDLKVDMVMDLMREDDNFIKFQRVLKVENFRND